MPTLFAGAFVYVDESTIFVGICLWYLDELSKSVKVQLLRSKSISPDIIPVAIIRAEVSSVEVSFVFRNNSHLRFAKLLVDNRSVNLPPLIELSELIKVTERFPIVVVKLKKSKLCRSVPNDATIP